MLTRSTIRMLPTAKKRSSRTSKRWQKTFPASACISSESSPKETTSSFIAIRNGRLTKTVTGPASISSGSTRRAGLWSTGTCCKSCRRLRPTTTQCFDRAYRDECAVRRRVVRVPRAGVLALLHGGDVHFRHERRRAERRRKAFVRALHHGDGGGRSRFAGVRSTRCRNGG